MTPLPEDFHAYENIRRRYGEPRAQQWLHEREAAKAGDRECARRNAQIMALQAQDLPVPRPRVHIPTYEMTLKRAEEQVGLWSPSWLGQQMRKIGQHLLDMAEPIMQKLAPAPACDCGSAKLGYGKGPQHSSWCPWSKT